MAIPTTTMRIFFSGLIAVSLLIFNGCAVLDLSDPKSPTISVEKIKPKNLGSNLQRLEIELLVQNPNRFDLQIQGIDFTAFIDGEQFAKGDSDQFVNIPALGEAVMEVQVVLGLADLLSQAARVFLEPDSEPLQYGITGTVDLENWPTSIPFNVDGEYSNPLQ